MTTPELLITALGSNAAAILINRLWGHFEHVKTAEKIEEVHVLVNSRLDAALTEIKNLRSEVKTLKIEKAVIEESIPAVKALNERN